MVKKEGDSEKRKMSKAELEETLIANFISLQKVLTNLSIRFDDLSNNINKLLQLFEISAKSFAEKYQDGKIASATTESDKEFLKKLDSLLDQNKTIAKGIMMMEEKVRERSQPAQSIQMNNPNQQQNMQPMNQFQKPEDRFKDMTRSREY